MKKSNIFTFTNGIILVVILLIAFFIYNKIREVTVASAPVQVTLNDSDHTIGNKSANISVIEFGDMQCPACKAFEEITNPVIAAYSDKVKFTFKHYPLTSIHPNAMQGAIAIEAASRQGKFWEMKKEMYAKQEEWSNSISAKEKFVSYAKELKLDVAKFTTDMEDPAIKAIIENSIKEGVALKLTGTPSVIINGERIDLNKISSVDLFRDYLDKLINATSSTSTSEATTN